MKDDKSVIGAIFLNLIIPGLGYIYMGRLLLGIFVFMIVSPIILLTAGIAWVPWAVIATADMVLLKRKREKDLLKQFKKCPQCAEHIQSEAHVCRYCNFKFNESAAA